MTTDKTLLLCAALLATACGDDQSSTADSMDTETGDETGDDGETAQASEGEDETEGEPATCGDGILDPGEACDDGSDNQANAACTPACTLNVCGDGFAFLDGGEGCDDGNKLDTDACLSTCAPASCGDGLVQDGVEACDDGDPTPGDACTASCQPAGAIRWSRHYDEMSCIALDVALTYEGFAAVLAHCDAPTLLMFTPNGDPMWEVELALDSASALELDSADNIVVVGQIEDHGSLAKYDHLGQEQWSYSFSYAGSSLRDVAITSNDSIVGVGEDMTGAGVSQFSATGDYEWGVIVETAPYTSVDIDASDTILALQGQTGVVTGYSPVGHELWQDQVEAIGGVGSITAGVDGSIYAESSLGESDEFAVHRLGADGEAWTAVHATPEVDDLAHTLEPLANGGVLAVGALRYSQAEADGLLSWYSPTGVNLLDVVLDGGPGPDADHLLGVDVRGEYGVATGIRFDGESYSLWLVQFAL